MVMEQKIILFSLLSLSVLVSATVVFAEEDLGLTKCLENCRSLPHYDVGMVRMCEQWCKMEHGGQEKQQRSEPVEVPDKEDPELARCLQGCRSQSHYDIGMEQRCEERCKKEHQPKKGEQQERRGPGEVQDKEDPELTRCLQDCRSQHHHDIGMQRRCEERCKKEHQPEKGGRQERRGSGEVQDGEDPELTKCLQECRSQHHYDIDMEQRCEERCKKEYQPGKEEQQERRGSVESQDDVDPEQRFHFVFLFLS